MNCLSHSQLIAGIDKTVNLSETFSGYGEHARSLVEAIETSGNVKFERWENLKSYYYKNLINTPFSVSYDKRAIDCQRVIEKFCLIEKAEEIMLLVPDEFENVVSEFHPGIDLQNVLNFMVLFSEPGVSLTIYAKHRQKFESMGLTIERYIESINEWLFTYTSIHKWAFESGKDMTYELTARLMAKYMSQQEIEKWFKNTIKKRYGDSIYESYWYWLRTLVIFNLCRYANFCLPLPLFEELLNSSLMELNMETEDDLSCLEDFFCMDELAGIILYHPYQSPIAEKILYLKKVRDRLMKGEKYDDLKPLLKQFNTELKNPHTFWSVKISKNTTNDKTKTD